MKRVKYMSQALGRMTTQRESTCQTRPCDAYYRLDGVTSKSGTRHTHEILLGRAVNCNATYKTSAVVTSHVGGGPVPALLINLWLDTLRPRNL